MSSFVVPPETKRRQLVASDPARSVWVSANAGSGKTYILARRVVRLLLDGANPGSILCLTYTKAAAAEMAERIAAILSSWVKLDDADLTIELKDVTEEAIDRDLLLRARLLFAQFLDVPGGLKIQTIHAFCERILHQFPFEANVASHFQVLEESEIQQLARDAILTTLSDAAAAPETPLGAAYQQLSQQKSDFALEDLLNEFLFKRAAGFALRAEFGTGDSLKQALYASFGFGPDFSLDTLGKTISFPPVFSRDRAASLLSSLDRSNQNDSRLAGRIECALENPHDPLAYFDLFLKSKDGGEPRSIKAFAAKTTRDANPYLDTLLDDEIHRLLPLYDQFTLFQGLEVSAAVLTLGLAALDRFQAAKERRSALDFNDLISRTEALLLQSDAANWVQFKLDERLDHILIDEAQDTSPEQWSVLNALSADFFAGESAAERLRTLFIVGDEKQSIYSFQGAAPELFRKSRDWLSDACHASQQTFGEVRLSHSFRSVQDVLSAVDVVFQGNAAAPGLTADNEPFQAHSAARAGDCGQVDVWDPVLVETPKEPEDWTAPLDHAYSGSAEHQLAQRIARQIRLWLDQNATLDDGHLIEPQHILILVRKRGRFVDDLGRMLKLIGVPVAGTDRLILPDHMIVKDLLAIGDFVLMPEDDLTLAQILKSPLIGFDDEDLIDLAPARKASLFAELRRRAETSEHYRNALETLTRWLNRADRLAPFEFFAQLLNVEGGRKAIARRFGAEADDILDEFLQRALDFASSSEPASMQKFLPTLRDSGGVLKRDIDRERNEVRIMTVHGAKGLESKIVFLVDTGNRVISSQHMPSLLDVDAPALKDASHSFDAAPRLLLTNRGKKANASVQKQALETWTARAQAEYRRLLYVAMTRAKDRLIVTGCKNIAARQKSEMPADGWYQTVRQALEPEGLAFEAIETGLTGFRWRLSPPPPKQAVQRTQGMMPQEPADDVPAWLTTPAAPPTPAVRELTPSQAKLLLTGDGLAGSQPEKQSHPQQFEKPDHLTAMMRGTLVHKLLQSLPDVAPQMREKVGLDYITRAAPEAAPAADAICAEALGILNSPDFACYFGDTSFAEVSLTGHLHHQNATQLQISGQIDLLVRQDDEILIIDYKTDRQSPDQNALPDDYVRQLSLYVALLKKIEKDKIIRAGLLWTKAQRIDWISDAKINEEIALLLGYQP